jgi:hypothetical protein
MAEYELFVDVEFTNRRGTPGQLETQTYKLEELQAKAASKEEILVELRDPSTMGSFKARVVLALTPEDLPGTDTLWLIRTSGRFSEPWGIHIVERIGEEETDVKALPRRRLSLAERKGRILSELLQEREDKLKVKKEEE